MRVLTFARPAAEMNAAAIPAIASHSNWTSRISFDCTLTLQRRTILPGRHALAFLLDDVSDDWKRSQAAASSRRP